MSKIQNSETKPGSKSTESRIKRFKTSIKIFMVFVVCTLASVSDTDAGIVINMQEIGANVVMTGSGTFATGTLGTPSLNSLKGIINPTNTIILFNDPTVPVSYDRFTSLSWSGPTDFGTGSGTFTDMHTGDAFGFNANVGSLFLPTGYNGIDTISSTMTFTGATLASLGVTPGSYQWDLDGTAATRFTLNASEAIPEPSTYALILTGLIGLGVARRKPNCR